MPRLLPRLPRRRPVPDDVRAVPVPAGEHRVAWGRTTEGAPVIATDRALVLPGGERLEWWQVERATWLEPQLAVVEVADVEATGVRHVLALQEEGDLPRTVHARVTGSVAWSVHHSVSPGGGVRLVGRRVPEAEVLTWQVVYDPGTDREDPLVRAQADQLLDEVKRSVG